MEGCAWSPAKFPQLSQASSSAIKVQSCISLLSKRVCFVKSVFFLWLILKNDASLNLYSFCFLRLSLSSSQSSSPSSWALSSWICALPCIAYTGGVVRTRNAWLLHSREEARVSGPRSCLWCLCYINPESGCVCSLGACERLYNDTVQCQECVGPSPPPDTQSQPWLCVGRMWRLTQCDVSSAYVGWRARVSPPHSCLFFVPVWYTLRLLALMNDSGCAYNWWARSQQYSPYRDAVKF